MRKISFMLLWIVAICTANAQVKHLAIEIANAQKENVVFTDISSSIKEASVQTQSLDLAEHFVNPNEVYVFDYHYILLQVQSISAAFRTWSMCSI